MPTDLRSTLHDLALAYATQIVAAVRSASLGELFEPDAGRETLADRVSQRAAEWAATYKMSRAEVDVLCRLLRDVVAPASGGVAASKRSGPARGGRSSSLESRIEELRRLAAQPASDSKRYAIGAIIKELKSHPEKYGDDAVRTAGAAVGEDQAGLYRFARVAERWSAREVKSLLSGGAISWSHLVELSRVESPAVRARLLRMVRREGMPMRDFHALVSRATK